MGNGSLETPNQLIQQAVIAHYGPVIKTVGDTFLVDFPLAVQCAQQEQAELRMSYGFYCLQYLGCLPHLRNIRLALPDLPGIFAEPTLLSSAGISQLDIPQRIPTDLQRAQLTLRMREYELHEGVNVFTNLASFIAACAALQPPLATGSSPALPTRGHQRRFSTERIHNEAVYWDQGCRALAAPRAPVAPLLLHSYL